MATNQNSSQSDNEIVPISINMTQTQPSLYTLSKCVAFMFKYKFFIYKNTAKMDTDDSETGSDAEKEAALKEKYSNKNNDPEAAEVNNRVRSYYKKLSRKCFKCNLCSNDKDVSKILTNLVFSGFHFQQLKLKEVIYAS